MTSTTFTIHAIQQQQLEQVRATGTDLAGNTVRVLVNTEPSGTPLRCCLREAGPGETVMLLAWSPFELSGPYTEVGPVFVHAQECGGYLATHEFPAAWRHRDQVVRGYDAAGDMVAAEVATAPHVEEVMLRLLLRDDVVVVHLRNVAAGCYMLAATLDR